MSNEEQIAYWNGDAGRKWAEKDHMMSQMLGPIARDLIAHAQPAGSRQVLDVGCGGGSETIMLAEHLGPEARILGVDVSEPLLEVATGRLAAAPALGERIEFLRADASAHGFAAGAFDFLFSRFGVMFFDDPTGAFANLRRALAPQARLAFCCWQALDNNPWVLIPLRAALEHLPPPEPPAPDAPGPFAFADPERVHRILDGAGFREVNVQQHAVTMSWGNDGGLETTVRDMLNMGPVGRLLADEDDATRDRVYASATEALAPHFADGRISLPGATWFVTARNG
jgi:SAM-dependent methyltransferase